MVLLTRQDAVPASFSHKRPPSAVPEQPDALGVASQTKSASFNTRHLAAAAAATGATATAASQPNSRRVSRIAAPLDGRSELDEAPLVVSGPLLPIRQARRGMNSNRSYRIVDTQSFSAGDLLQHTDAMEAMLAPPTPVSASAGSYSSRGSGSSRASSNSSASSGGNSVSDTLSTTEDALAARSRQIRVYDKNHMLGVSELPMGAAELPVQHARSHSSSARPPHGAEHDGRSGAVLVSSLLPSARTSPIASARRALDRSVSPRDSTGAGAGLAAQQYYVRRVSNGPLTEHERLSNELAARSASQICIASPKARLHEQQLRALSLDSVAPDGLAPRTATAERSGELAAYYADSEMDGNHYAMSSIASERQASDTVTSRAAARESWNIPSDDNNAAPSDRQRKRQAVRTSVTTEKYQVSAVSASSGVQLPLPSRQFVNGDLIGSPELVAHATPGPPPIASVSVKDFISAAVADGFYEASSSDEEPLVQEAHVHYSMRDRSNDQARANRPGKVRGPPPVLEHRATSFDLGRIGRSGFDGFLAPKARVPSHASMRGRGGDSVARHLGSHSGPRAALAGLSEAAEKGYEGDSEGIMRAGSRVPVQRRNTVAGDKVDEMLALASRSAGMKESRNTNEYADLMAPAKDDRRSMRGSRRRPSANPLLPIGTQIAPGHANYVLMYNMLTGIRVSVSRCEAKDSRPVRFDDYIAAHKYSFDVVGDEMTPSSRYDFKFKDYAPWVFRCIREAFHLSTEDYLVSLTDKYILSEVGSSGKSGSFFYYSQDYRFIIKTVHHTEHKFMREILPQYYEFVRDHPNTLLSRIYGLHRIKLPHGRKVHFIVMSNILPPNKDIHAQFDLKGSMLGRELSAELAAKPRACMKDKNWVKMRQRLHLGPIKRRAFVKQLIEDVTLLIRLNIMDYSLLIGIHDLNKGNAAKLRDTTLAMFDPQTTEIQQLNRLTRAHTIRKKVVRTDPVTLDALPLGTVPPLPEAMFQELRYSVFYREDGGILSTDPNDCPSQLIYYLGVIDILTPYNMVKRTEHFVKALVHDGSQISAINPRKYGLRFLRFMIRSLEGCEDVLPLLEEFERTTYQEICREHRIF